MNSRLPHFLARTAAGAFSLVEVTLAMGLVSVAVIATFGLISIGLNSARDSTDDTVTSLIFQDLGARLQGQPMVPKVLTPYYYSKEGVAVKTAAQKDAYYQATITLGKPVGTSADADVLSAVVEVKWPVVNGVVPNVSSARSSTFSTLVTTSTPPAWVETQATFQPKINL